jgi:hypothetical protein
MPEFENETESRTFVYNFVHNALLDHKELTESLSSQIWNVLVSEHSRNLLIKRLKWVIQDEELELVQSLCRGSEAAIGVGVVAFTAHSDLSSVLAGVSGILTTMIDLIVRIRRKGAFITKDSALILGLLRTNRAPMSPEEISLILRKKDQTSLEPTQVAVILNSLKATKLGDGNLVALVERNEDNRWWTVGI